MKKNLFNDEVNIMPARRVQNDQGICLENLVLQRWKLKKNKKNINQKNACDHLALHCSVRKT
jgi:hypothetical protein